MTVYGSQNERIVIDRRRKPHRSTHSSSSQDVLSIGNGFDFGSGGNVCGLLVRREVCPRGGRSRLSKKLRRGTSNPRANSLEQDVWHALISWVEAESLLHLSAKYCPLLPPPRSTIAAAFSPDGKTLASTHGDHTVKITNFHTGSSLKVLRGHRRTPWVVRFHPLCPEILASGSLDHEVRLWDANTAECIGSRNFYRPIASIAFHALGEFLAVASGHKLYIWHYNKIGETSLPAVILKTRRSLRAVHFHPHAAPFLLTAEVNDLDTSESTMALATSPGYLHYPPPTIYVANTRRSSNSQLVDELPLLSLPFLMWTSFSGDVGRTSAQQAGNVVSSYGQQGLDLSSSVRLRTYSTPSGQYELLLSPIEPSSSSHVAEETQMDDESPQFSMDNVESTEVHPSERDVFPIGGQIHWESPFLRGWLIGQTQAGLNMMGSPNASAPENITASSETENPASSSAILINADQSWDSGRSDLHYRSLQSQTMSEFIPGESAASNSFPHSINETSPVVSRIQSELAATLAAATAAELPCTVKLRIWPHDVRDPCASLDPKHCRLTIPHAVLCSEMGAHFSPCGRYLAACVACTLPHMEADIEVQDQVNPNITGAATSPTRHPISAHRVMYELRIYSLEEARFGSVLASRAIRAAHCLTSIQFSPTSEHLLLAYGRRHSSLLKSIVIDGETTVPIYTILEVYRVSDMELVQVLPSTEDEVNVACFHPSVGGGLVYGTKEGKLRILNYNSSHDVKTFIDSDWIEVPTHALEC